MPVILAEEVDHLTLEQIQKWDQSACDGNSLTINIIDQRNMTEQRLQRLRSLFQRWQDISPPLCLDAAELDAKLRSLLPVPSPSTSTNSREPPSTPITAGGDVTDEQSIEHMKSLCRKTRSQLRRLGGRPTRESTDNSDPYIPSAEYETERAYQASDHWGRRVEQAESEWNRWMQFRRHQFESRRTPAKQTRYIQDVHSYTEEQGLDWILELSLSHQTKIDEWREYLIFERRKCTALEQRLAGAQQDLATARQQAAELERCKPLGTSQEISSGQWQELLSYDTKRSRAEKDVNITQKRLDALSSSNELSVTAKEMLIPQTQQDLLQAQNTLHAHVREDMEQLNAHVEFIAAQEAAVIAQGRVDNLATSLERSNALLDWITSQLVEISQAATSECRQEDQSVQGSWSEYYTYMQDRLMSGEARGDDDCWTEKMHPDRSEKWLQALLVWMTQYLPHLTAQPVSSTRTRHERHRDDTHASLSLMSSRLISPKRKNPRTVRRHKNDHGQLQQVKASRVSKSAKTTEAGGLAREKMLRRKFIGDTGRTNATHGQVASVRRSARIANQVPRPQQMFPSSNPRMHAPPVQPPTMSDQPPTKLPRRSARLAKRLRERQSIKPLTN